MHYINIHYLYNGSSKVSNIEYIDTDAIHENDKDIERTTYDIILENIDDNYHTIIFVM